MLGEVILKAVIILVFGVPLVAGCLTLYVGAVWMQMQDDMKNKEQESLPDGRMRQADGPQRAAGHQV